MLSQGVDNDMDCPSRKAEQLIPPPLPHPSNNELLRCKCFVLNFFVDNFLWISSDEHDSRFQESSLRQRQIKYASIKGR
ncbi:hypothetical protein J6590_003727 [Homalodisca vitripennis]|nr:hypothetical protein J6590_003727 [Homalodisca vitripennis]